MWRRRAFWIVLLIVVIGGTGALYAYQSAAATDGVEEVATEPQTATVRRGSIVVSAGGAGTVVPSTELDLGFQSGGVLTEVLVEAGDTVEAGRVLARIDDSAAAEAVANAELQLANIRMRVDGAATDSGISFNDIALEQSQLNLDQAEETLDNLLTWEPDPDEIARAEASVVAAQAAYAAAQGSQTVSSSSVQVSAINVEQAERDLADAQETYDAAFDPGRDWELQDPRLTSRLEGEREAAERALQRAEDNLTVARANYQATVANSSGTSLASASSSLLNAELALEAAREGPSENEIDAARRSVRQAELNLQQVRLNAEADRLDEAQAQLNLQSARDALEATALVAPAGGTVLSVKAAVGERVGSEPLVVLADLSQPTIEIYLDESDLSRVGLGYQVNVTFDALVGESFRGSVIRIDPQLTMVSGVSVVRALVRLENDAKPQPLPVGLNATVEVISGQANNALLVPVEAVREIAPEQYAVFVMVDGVPELTMVEVGLMDFTLAQIVSGVAEGDVVTTGIVETE